MIPRIPWMRPSLCGLAYLRGQRQDRDHRRTGKAKYTAAMMFLLDGYSAEEVVKAVPEVLTANNLYQICRRVRRAIAEAARRPGSVLAELCSD